MTERKFSTILLYSANPHLSHQSATVAGGAKAAGVGLGAGLVASVAAQRAGLKAYRSLTLPLKAFALTYVPLRLSSLECRC